MDHEEMTLEQQVADDLLYNVDASDFIYEKDDDNNIVAVHYSDEGKLLARYAVKVTLEKL